MKRLLITALLVTVGLSTFAQWDVRNKIFRQIANGDTIITRIWDGYDTYDGSNPIHVNYYDSTAFVGSRGMGVGGHFAVYDSAHVYGNTSIRDTTFTNTISPYSGTTTTFPQRLSVNGSLISGNAATDTTLITGRTQITSGSLYLDSTSTTGLGAIYKGGNRWLSDFRHPTGGTARPIGYNIFIGENAGNLTMGSTAITTAQGSYNIAIGSGSGLSSQGRPLGSATAARSSIAIGAGALVATTTTAGNIAIGVNAGLSNVTGADNTYIGSSTATWNTLSNNVVIGSGAGVLSGTTNPQISNSVYIGMESRTGIVNQANQIVIGYQCVGNGANTVALGNGVGLWSVSQNLSNTTAGSNLIIRPSSAFAGGTADLNGGMLTIAPGESKGKGFASFRAQRNSRAASTGTTLNALSDAFIIPSSRIVANNSDSVIFTCTPLAADTALYGNSVAGSIHYEVAVKGSDGYQSESGEINFTAVRYAGTVTATIGIDHERESLSSSTLVVTPSLTYVGGLWTVTINVNSGLTSPAVKLDYTVLKGTSAPNLIQK